MSALAVEPPSVDPIDRPVDPSRSVRRRIAVWLDARVLLAGVVVAAARYWFAADRRVFHIVADEPGQLAMARWLSGGTDWNMFDHSTWRPGFALLLAPWLLLADTGEEVVRTALTLNAVIAGLSTLVLARMLRRWTSTGAGATPSLGPWTIATIAAVVGVAPAAISASAYTWAEPLVTTTFLVTVWWAQRFVDSGRASDAIGATLAATAAITTHGRLLPLLPTVALAAAALLALRRRRRDAVVVLGVAAAGAAVSLAFTGWVRSSVWEDPNQVNGSGSVIERLDAPVALFDSVVGQSWYQLAGWLGMTGIGVALVAAALLRPASGLDRRSAAVLVVLTAPLVLTSMAFMAGRDRADQLVYGRYTDAVIWPFTALGIAAVVTMLSRRAGESWFPLRRRFALLLFADAAACAALGALVAWRHGDELADDIGLRMMVAGLLPYVGRTDSVPVVTITAVVAASGLVLAGAVRAGLRAGRVGGVVAVIVLAATLVWAGVRVHDGQAGALNRWAIADDVARLDAIVPADEQLGVVIVRDSQDPSVTYTRQRQRYQVYQLYLTDRTVAWERSPDDPSLRWLLAPADDPTLTGLGAVVRWRDPAVGIVLWELPG